MLSGCIGLLQELANDPLNIFKAPSKLQHRLVLSSAYAASHEAAADADSRHRRRNDQKHHEPKVPCLLSAIRTAV